MSRAPCTAPLSWPELVAYDRGELSDADAERMEAHYFACARCTSRLEAIPRIGAGIVELIRAGAISSSVTSDVVARASSQGLTLRSYRLAPGEQVACTAAPGDDFVVIRLAIDLDPAESVDVAAEITHVDSGARRTQLTEDVAFDSSSRELVFLFAGDVVRSLPRTRWDMEAHVRGPGGERRIGPYTLDHTPWELLPQES
jgi:hypothetical protein